MKQLTLILLVSITLFSCRKHYTAPVDVEIRNLSVQQSLLVRFTDHPTVLVNQNSSVVLRKVKQSQLTLITITTGSNELDEVEFQELHPDSVFRMEVSTLLLDKYSRKEIDAMDRGGVEFVLSCNQREPGTGIDLYEFSFFQADSLGRQ